MFKFDQIKTETLEEIEKTQSNSLVSEIIEDRCIESVTYQILRQELCNKLTITNLFIGIFESFITTLSYIAILANAERTDSE